MRLVQLALKQYVSARGLALVLGMGVLVAGVLLAMAPIYARSMADLGLTYTIREELEGSPSSRVEVKNVPLTSAEGVAFRETIERRIDERVGWFRESQERSLQMGYFWVGKNGEIAKVRPPLAQPRSVTNFQRHVTITEGRFPETQAGPVIEGALSTRSAQALGVKVGDTIDLNQFFDNCEREIPLDAFPPPPPPCPITEFAEFSIQARIVGLVEPIDPEDPFWVDTLPRYFEPQAVAIDNTGALVQLYTTEATLLEGLGGLLPNYRAYTQWAVTANAEQLNRSNFLRARDDLVELYRELEPYDVFAVSPLRDTLLRFGRTADYQQVPLTILLLEITGIALFYVALISAIVVERQAHEIALLRGRGASILQILSIYLVQGLVLGIPAVFAAPFLAAGITWMLGLTPLFDRVTGGDPLPVTIVPISFGLAAGAVVLALLALLVPALVVALRGPTGTKLALARPGNSIFQRYYLDLAMAVVAVILLYQLRQRGSVFEPSSTGGLSSDPLLLATPALAIAAAGALLLRFYPMVMRLVSRATRPVAGPAFALGTWQLARNSGQYTRLALLVMMAVAVGTFAASYTRTADRSYEDRANYEAGVDMRASTGTGIALGVDRDTFEADAMKIEGVTAATSLVRAEASIATPGSNSTLFQVLGLDPKGAGQQLWFRDDLAPESLSSLLAKIDGLPALPGKAIPPGTTALKVWARTDDAANGLTLRAGLRDADGRYRLVELAELDTLSNAWQEFTTKPGALDESKQPMSIVSIVVTGTNTRPGGATVLMDDITAVSGSSAAPVEDFEGSVGWSLLPTTQNVPDVFAPVTENPHGGRQSVRFQLRAGSQNDIRGAYVSGFLTPLPVLASQSFLDQTGLGVGGQALLRVSGSTLVPVVVRGVFELFPTTESRDGAVVIFNRDRLLAWADIAFGGLGSPIQLSEVWLGLAEGADAEAVEERVREVLKLENVTTREEALAAATKNPLIAASGSGILFAAFIAVLGLVAAAMLTSLLAAVRRRRTEFAVIRAIGLSRGQLLGMLTLEYALVFAVGIAAGCLMGLFVSERMLAFLSVTEAGEKVEPGFILQTRWGLVAGGVGAVVVFFAISLWVAARAVGGSAQAQALRGE